MFELGRYSGGINLTGMGAEEMREYIKKCNRDIARDYYKKHPLRKILSFTGLDHLRLDLLLRNFTVKDIRPLIEAILWATLGKRKNAVGMRISRFIYKSQGTVGNNGNNRSGMEHRNIHESEKEYILENVSGYSKV